MRNPEVVIIILQYNDSQDTIRCLNSVKELHYQNFETIVVDNNSRTDQHNSIRLFIESQVNAGTKIHFLINSENLGYSGGNNRGIEFALKIGTDYVLLLNPDAEVKEDLLAKLIEKAESDPKIGIIGSAIDEGKKIIYGGKIEWLKPELMHNERLGSDSGLFISGAAMLIKKEVIQKIGMLDEKYFLYFEDADYCMKARRAGYSLAIVPDALAYHRVSTTTGELGTAVLLYYHYRNAHLFNQKNAPWPIKISLPFWSFWIIIKQFLKIIFTPSKRQISYYILRGVGDFYKRRFGKYNDEL